MAKVEMQSESREQVMTIERLEPFQMMALTT